MCWAQASTTIASQEVKWGIETSRPFLGKDWTKDPVVWENFKQQLLEIPGLTQMHFMGGETLLTPRLEDLVDFMIKHKRFDQCFSFVTNGTVYKHSLMEKLSKFKRVGIEISMESLGLQNSYVRQGTDTNLVLENIKKFESWCNGSGITVAFTCCSKFVEYWYIRRPNAVGIAKTICGQKQYISSTGIHEHCYIARSCKGGILAAFYSDVTRTRCS